MLAADEARLIQRAQLYDQDAIGQLYRENVQVVFRFVYLRVSDAHIAEDLTSDVFLRALQGLGAYQYRGIPFAAWLFKIARDRVVDYYRRCDRCPPNEELFDTLEDDCEQPHEAVMRTQEEAQVRVALAELTEDQRLVIQLRFIEQLSLAEVARQMEKTEGAVKSLQHRALAALSRILEANG